MSLIELIMAGTIMTMIAGSMGMLAMSVQQNYAHSASQALANQHGRVALQRVERALSQAHGSESFPGFVVFEEQIGDDYFPQLLAVWKPGGSPVDPAGLPRFNELVIFTPHPGQANRFLEVTAPSDSRQVPPLDNVSAWQAELTAMMKSSDSQLVDLTDQIRRGTVMQGGAQSANTVRGGVRFHVEHMPTMADWTAYKAGTLTWDDLDWPQGLAGDTSGVRRCWCKIELQMAPESSQLSNKDDVQNVVPFFGSGTIQYQLSR